MLFTELNTDVLLYIYGRLDPIDSINLAETCTRLRDVAQLHYKRFKIFNLEHFIVNGKYGRNKHRHNRIDATTVLKHIGPFIRDLAADFSTEKTGSDVSTSIRKYCVNVKTLNIGMNCGQLYDTTYVDWLSKLNLKKVLLPARDLFLIDLLETTTLDELHFHYDTFHQYSSVDYDLITNIFERNVNVSCLRIQVTRDFKYEIFEKLKCLKRLMLDIGDDENGGQLEKVAANLKMTTLEKVEIYGTQSKINGLNEFLQKLSENALHLKHLSIANFLYVILDAYPLSSLHLLNLTSLRWTDKHPHLYKEIPKVQPNLTHVDLIIYEGKDIVLTSYIGETLPKPEEQIVFLIKNLEKLELLHIRFNWIASISPTLKDFLQESVLCRIFDCHSINRPTVTLRLFPRFVYDRFVQVELDFGARNWTWTTMKTDHHNAFVEHPSKLPFYDTKIETIDDLLAVQRCSGSANDLNAEKDETNDCMESLKW